LGTGILKLFSRELLRHLWTRLRLLGQLPVSPTFRPESAEIFFVSGKHHLLNPLIRILVNASARQRRSLSALTKREVNLKDTTILGLEQCIVRSTGMAKWTQFQPVQQMARRQLALQLL
jgi:hypothetical protein